MRNFNRIDLPIDNWKNKQIKLIIVCDNSIIIFFKPETFWYLDTELNDAKSGKSFNVKWSRVHLFDKEVVYLFYNELKQASCATVTDVVLQEKTKQKPAALNTVELLRAASKGKLLKFLLCHIVYSNK